jgi:hypothetical protein
MFLPFTTLEETGMNLFQRYLAEEFAEDYEEGRLSRRDALKLIAICDRQPGAANSILAACTPSPESPGTSLPSLNGFAYYGTSRNPRSVTTAESVPTDRAAMGR